MEIKFKYSARPATGSPFEPLWWVSGESKRMKSLRSTSERERGEEEMVNWKGNAWKLFLLFAATLRGRKTLGSDGAVPVYNLFYSKPTSTAPLLPCQSDGLNWFGSVLGIFRSTTIHPPFPSNRAVYPKGDYLNWNSLFSGPGELRHRKGSGRKEPPTRPGSETTAFTIIDVHLNKYRISGWIGHRSRGIRAKNSLSRWMTNAASWRRICCTI